MDQAYENFERYLNIESLLNTFFSVFNYCFNNCIKSEIFRNNGNPVPACCKDKYYNKYDIDHPSFDLLTSKRIALYGNPEDHYFNNPVSPCEYHNPESGCVLATHKSPICLSFMCQESIVYLREHYLIYEYDYLGMNYALEWILTADFSDSDYYDLVRSIKKMTAIISGSETTTGFNCSSL